MTIHIGCGRILVCKRNNGNCLSFQLNDSPTLNGNNRIIFELSILVDNVLNFIFLQCVVLSNSVKLGNLILTKHRIRHDLCTVLVSMTLN